MSRIAGVGAAAVLFAAVLLAQPPKPEVVRKPAPSGTTASRPPPKAESVFGSDRHAVIIGVNDYADEGIPDLRMAEADARAVHRVLTDPSVGGVPAKQATLLLGKNATTREVRRALARLRALPKRATVFVYFSGHGMTEAGDGYWITQDAEVNDLAATCLSDTELRKFLGDVAAERLLVMIDACYAAATVNGQQNAAKGLDDVLQKFTGKGHAILSASGDGEQALEANDLKHSVFTYFLLEGLRGKADEDADGVVVLPELTNYLDAHVADEARKRQGIQKPVVDLKGVQEPKKFQLVIDAPRLLALRTAAAESQAARERRLAKLRDLALDEKLSVEQHREGKRLLEANPTALTKPDQLALVEYERVLDGKLAPEKLALALKLISSTPTTPSSPQVVTGTQGNALRSSAGVELVLIPAGEFLMGSPDSDSDADGDEKPQRKVKITRPFYLGKHEVTKGQFAKFVAAKSYKTEPERDGEGGWGYNPATGKFEGRKPQYTWRSTGWTPYEDDHPVVNVTWNDAIAFCNWQSEAEGLTPCYRADGASFVAVAGNGHRLPTEAEWEYACRAGTTTPYSSGNDPEALASVGNVADGTAKAKFSDWSSTIAAKDGFVFTAPVGNFKANAFGLHDMHGNVWEWCADWYDDKYYATRPETDPQGPSLGSYRVDRGGGWIGWAAGCRSADRGRDTPGNRSHDLGFRLARSSVK